MSFKVFPFFGWIAQQLIVGAAKGDNKNQWNSIFYARKDQEVSPDMRP